MNALNPAVLINLLGFTVGVALYALLFVMVARYRGKNTKIDLLLLTTEYGRAFFLLLSRFCADGIPAASFRRFIFRARIFAVGRRSFGGKIEKQSRNFNVDRLRAEFFRCRTSLSVGDFLRKRAVKFRAENLVVRLDCAARRIAFHQFQTNARQKNDLDQRAFNFRGFGISPERRRGGGKFVARRARRAPAPR